MRSTSSKWVSSSYLQYFASYIRKTPQKHVEKQHQEKRVLLRCFSNVTRKILKIWRRYSFRTCRSHRALSFTKSTRPLKMNIWSSKIGKTKIFSFKDFFSFTIILCCFRKNKTLKPTNLFQSNLQTYKPIQVWTYKPTNLRRFGIIWRFSSNLHHQERPRF